MNGFIKKLDSDETGGKCCCCVNLRQSVIRESRRERFQGDLLASGGEKRFSLDGTPGVIFHAIIAGGGFDWIKAVFSLEDCRSPREASHFFVQLSTSSVKKTNIHVIENFRFD